MVHDYAAAARAAALRTVGFAAARPPVVRRINMDWPYAAVLTRGGMLEGAPVTEPILLRHFSFGWQALDLLNRCSASAQHLSPAARARLTRGMPPLEDHRCGRVPSDAGPPAEIDAVRRLMRGPLIPYVVVSGGWAMGGWYGAGGGETLFRRENGAWKTVSGGGGAMGVAEMRKFGVPQTLWCKFGIYDAKCE